MNHSGTSTAMGREPGSAKPASHIITHLDYQKRCVTITPLGERCERCGGMVYPGDWPWCRGNPKDHLR